MFKMKTLIPFIFKPITGNQFAQTGTTHSADMQLAPISYLVEYKL